MFDWTISLGVILQVLTVGGGGLVILTALKSDNKNLHETHKQLVLDVNAKHEKTGKDIESIRLDMKDMLEAFSVMARQDAQIAALNRRVDDDREGDKEWRHQTRNTIATIQAEAKIGIAECHRRIDGLRPAM